MILQLQTGVCKAEEMLGELPYKSLGKFDIEHLLVFLEAFVIE